jgi:hypothetical protein
LWFWLTKLPAKVPPARVSANPPGASRGWGAHLNFVPTRSPAGVAAGFEQTVEPGFQPGGWARAALSIVDSGRQDAALSGIQGWLPPPPDGVWSLPPAAQK